MSGTQLLQHTSSTRSKWFNSPHIYGLIKNSNLSSRVVFYYSSFSIFLNQLWHHKQTKRTIINIIVIFINCIMIWNCSYSSMLERHHSRHGDFFLNYCGNFVFVTHFYQPWHKDRWLSHMQSYLTIGPRYNGVAVNYVQSINYEAEAKKNTCKTVSITQSINKIEPGYLTIMFMSLL